MTLDLFPSDLKPEHANTTMNQINFHCFKENVRKAIEDVGEATYYGTSIEFKAILLPKSKMEKNPET